MHGHLLTLILSMWMTCIDVFASFWFWLHFELDRQTRDQSSCVMCYLGLKIGGEELFIIFMEGREEGNLLRVNARCSFCLSTLIWQVYTVKYVNYDIFTWLTSYLIKLDKQMWTKKIVLCLFEWKISWLSKFLCHVMSRYLWSLEEIGWLQFADIAETWD